MNHRRNLGPSRFLAILATVLISGACSVSAQAKFPDLAASAEETKQSGIQTLVVAGGCFWGIEGVFERLKGVTEAVSGYSGGQANTADYETVCSGTTGHAESVRIKYDPKIISLGNLLKVFFSVAHNPTELNFQGPDHGTQYRSVIFYANEFQKSQVEQYIQALTQAKLFSRPIVTQVVPLVAFYPAEDYHQDFMKKHPDHPYIQAWDQPKVDQLARLYPELSRTKGGQS